MSLVQTGRGWGGVGGVGGNLPCIIFKDETDVPGMVGFGSGCDQDFSINGDFDRCIRLKQTSAGGHVECECCDSAGDEVGVCRPGKAGMNSRFLPMFFEAVNNEPVTTIVFQGIGCELNGVGGISTAVVCEG